MTSTESTAVAESDRILIRLLRCMTVEERESLVRPALETLARRCSLHPYHQQQTPQELERELRTEDLDERLAPSMPYTWPWQDFVMLEHLIEPGSRIDLVSEIFAVPVLDVLFGEEWMDDQNADCLVEHYMPEHRDSGFEFPSRADSDAYNPRNEWTQGDVELARDSFIEFLRCWRERVIKTLEEQNPRRIEGFP